MDNSPLARLPPELRNHIYELVLCSSEAFCITAPPYSNPPRRRKGLWRDQREKVGILRTCKAIYHETRGALYGSNTFIFRPRDVDGMYREGYHERPTYERFRRHIGEASASALRRVVFEADSYPHLSVHRFAGQLRYAARVASVLVRGLVKVGLFCRAMNGTGGPRTFVLSFDMKKLQRSFDEVFDRFVSEAAGCEAHIELQEVYRVLREECMGDLAN